jgi:hypothetical protein
MNNSVAAEYLFLFTVTRSVFMAAQNCNVKHQFEKPFKNTLPEMTE